MESKLNNSINYWDVINEINWYELSKDKTNEEATELVKDFCLKNYSFDDLVDINNFIYEKKELLKLRIYSFLKTVNSEEKNSKYKEFLSDDFVDEATTHIVGMGETFYDYIYNNAEQVYSVKKNIKSNLRFGVCLAQEEIVSFS